jgi:uncharacterized membrane protein
VARGVPSSLIVHAHEGGHRFFWLLLLVGFLVLAGLAVAWLVRLTRDGPAGAAAAPDAALESVRLRYARGEIDRDEFVRVSTDLGAPPPAPAT